MSQPRPVLEVGDILRQHGDAFRAAQGQRLSTHQKRVLSALECCRTAALGGHVEACDACGVVRISYNSCRNRHCPRCRGGARALWLQQEAQSLLPTEYFHVVFTLPAEVAALALANRAVVYGLLFQAASATVREVAADPKYLGAEVGMLAVLHTWGQNLHHHPHVHCVVSGGGLSCDEQGVVDPSPHWQSCRPGFFLPVRVLSRVYRGKLVQGLRQAYEGGALSLGGSLAVLQDPAGFACWIKSLYQKEWVVYAKPPFGGPEQVLKYLAAYTHGVAITNHRLVSLEEGEVSFVWKDYAHGSKQRVMRLSAEEFLRRFCLHILPRGFVRIRHYGLLANRSRQGKLALCRHLLGVRLLQSVVVAWSAQERRCPVCGVGVLRVIEMVPVGGCSEGGAPREVWDSS